MCLSVGLFGFTLFGILWASWIWMSLSFFSYVIFSYYLFKQDYFSFLSSAAAAAKSLQSCLTLCDSIDGSPPGSAIPGILKARTQEWVAISFSNAWKGKLKVKSLSRVQLSVTPWPPFMGVSRQEYWSGVPSPSPGGALGRETMEGLWPRFLDHSTYLFYFYCGIFMLLFVHFTTVIQMKWKTSIGLQ